MFKKLRTFKNFPKARSRFTIFLMLAVICVVTMGAVYDATAKKVTVTEINAFENIENSTVIKTRQTTVEDFLNENNISVNLYDNINMISEDELSDKMEIRIRRGVAITIVTSTGEELVSTTKSTVGEALTENGIFLNPEDETTPSRETLVTSDMIISVSFVTSQFETVEESIAFNTVKQNDDKMYKGNEKVITEGVNGSKDVTYKVTFRDGVEFARELSSEIVTVEPVDKVVTMGTKEKTVAVKQTKGFASGTLSSRGDLRYKKVITVTATAYDPSPEQNGGYSRTALGGVPRFGIIAVDPKVIPLGSRVYVESTDDGNSWVYGYAIAGDTGGAIKGNRIDLCYNTASQARAFGRRSATIYVLE